MAIPKKGSRKITVDDIDYRWRATRYRKVSDWKDGSDLLDDEFVSIADRFGLGQIAEVCFNIPVELYEMPKSKLLIKYYGYVVDGFMGIEQISSIKPAFIAEVIRKNIETGWQPEAVENRTVKCIEKIGEKQKPQVLILPGQELETEYDNIINLETIYQKST